MLLIMEYVSQICDPKNYIPSKNVKYWTNEKDIVSNILWTFSKLAPVSFKFNDIESVVWAETQQKHKNKT